MPPSFAADTVRIHPRVQSTYDTIQRDAVAGRVPAAAIWKGLELAFERAARSAQFADNIPTKRIPRFFRERYGVPNLYCVDLADFHRAFYTIRERFVVFLDVVDHRTYDKLFGRRKK